MTNTTTNYSYDTIPGNVEEEAATDPGENHNTQKDENIRRTKKVGVLLASGVLGFLCLVFFVVGRHTSHHYRTSVGTTAASSSSVSFLPFNSANRVPNCQEWCAAREVEFCSESLQANHPPSLLALCKEGEQVCVEECSSAAMLSCDNIRETTYELCLLWKCKDISVIHAHHNLHDCFDDEEDDCRTEANTVYAQQHCTNRPTVAPTPALPTPAPVPLPAGSKCSSTAECAVPDGLEHPVCRQGKCQRGVYKDYCGQDSDCLSNNCVGKTDIAKCKK